MKKVFLFPGSFDPIAVKHAYDLRTLLDRPDAHAVLFIPTSG